MGKLKEFYHDQICEGLHPDDWDSDKEDKEIAEHEALREQAEPERIAALLEEEDFYKECEEREKFFRIYDATHTYPM